jgi:myo-inositol 2-dehydrogenase/D-chiro-inositol 1-dehydrogenase
MRRLGLIGCGRIGRVHALSISRNPDCTLSKVYDPSLANASQIADRDGATVAASADELIRSSDVDAVIIASPTNMHKEHFLAAARAGKPIYGEKPIDVDLERAAATILELRREGIPIMLGLNRRYDRDHATLRSELHAGSIGRVQSMQLASRGPDSAPTPEYIRSSGGFYRDKCVHFLDLIRWISGDEAVEIAAMGSVVADPHVGEHGDIDTAAIIVRLKSGALAHIDNARRATHGYDDRIEVFGTGGMIESSRLRRGNVTRIIGTSMQLDGLTQTPFERYGETYAAALGAFLDLIEGKPGQYPTMEDGFIAQAMAEAAILSAEQGRTVKLADITDRFRSGADAILS